MIYIVTDLGPGDGGKGGVVHKIATMTDAKMIVKVGGAQGSHGVCTSRGERFAFSQWGCGTLEGIRTHISQRMIVFPEGLINESDALRYQFGMMDAFDLLTADRRALCATPYHGISSRLKEMARKDDPRGTIGTGVGEAYRYSVSAPELSILVGDLTSPDVIERKLSSIRERMDIDLRPVVNGDFLDSDREAVKEELELLRDDDFLRYSIRKFLEVGERLETVDEDFLKKEIFSSDGTVVVESSHGVLTDAVRGFFPHVSAIRTLPKFAEDMLGKSGFTGETVNIGVTRAYQIRHGAGPMPTEEEAMVERLLPGSHKGENRYQGKVRVGPLDFNLLRYAIGVSGGPSAFDGLAVTWFDQIVADGKFDFCDRYSPPLDPEFFDREGALKIGDDDGTGTDRQTSLGRRLSCSTPEIGSIVIPEDKTPEELYELASRIFLEKTGVPVKMISFGPTENDKICKNLNEWKG